MIFVINLMQMKNALTLENHIKLSLDQSNHQIRRTLLHLSQTALVVAGLLNQHNSHILSLLFLCKKGKLCVLSDHKRQEPSLCCSEEV